jgi:hypothetical protein
VFWERSHEEWTIGNQNVNMPKLNRYITARNLGLPLIFYDKAPKQVVGSAPITGGSIRVVLMPDSDKRYSLVPALPPGRASGHSRTV